MEKNKIKTNKVGPMAISAIGPTLFYELPEELKVILILRFRPDFTDMHPKLSSRSGRHRPLRMSTNI